MKVYWIAATAVLASVSPPLAQDHKHVLVPSPSEINWSAAPPVLPKGVQAALLWGDPSKEGPFVLRLKFPPNVRVLPHSHPGDEIVTVISGEFNLGKGREFDESKVTPIRAGGFSAMSKGTEHFAIFREETVIQISTVGPWTLNYINPEDDPRKSQ